jgi:hypothetical protein
MWLLDILNVFKPSPVSEYLDYFHLGDCNYFVRNTLFHKYLCYCSHKFLAMEFLSQVYANFDGFWLHITKLFSRKVE